MSNSNLVTQTRISPCKTSPRNHKIDTFTPHCFVGQVTVERGLQVFQVASKQASCNYLIGYDGGMGLCVEEKDRSWCTSSKSNDHRAITFEIASDTVKPYKMTDAAVNSLIKLMVDICQRNGKKKVLWFGDKNRTLAYNPKDDEMVITVHRWFAKKDCPGDYLYERLGYIADQVNNQLSGLTSTPAPIPAPTVTAPTAVSMEVPFRIRVANVAANDTLCIRKTPSATAKVMGQLKHNDPNVYTIVAVEKGWGKLKSGIGWINLKYTKRV